MTTSKWVCVNGHEAWSPRWLDVCPHGCCGADVRCVSGPYRPKKDKTATQRKAAS